MSSLKVLHLADLPRLGVLPTSVFSWTWVPDSLSLGVDVEVDVDELNQEQVADLNKQATTYGMADGDFVR